MIMRGPGYMKTATKKRAYQRIPVDIEITYEQFNTKYSGTVKNISKNGMYIESDTPLSFNSKLDLHLPYKSKLKVFVISNNNVLGFPVRVKRLVKDETSFIGMGVMLLNSSPSYKNFMNSLTQAN